MKSERKLKAKQLVAVNLPDGTVSILMVSACGGVYSLAENGWVPYNMSIVTEGERT